MQNTKLEKKKNPSQIYYIWQLEAKKIFLLKKIRKGILITTSERILKKKKKKASYKRLKNYTWTNFSFDREWEQSC